jgi:hypothetical protein
VEQESEDSFVDVDVLPVVVLQKEGSLQSLLTMDHSYFTSIKPGAWQKIYELSGS